MTVDFIYSLEDVEKEFKEILNSTADFGRNDADFTEDEYNFRIRQLASCTAQLMKEDRLLKSAVESIGKHDFGGFDPRYESRFTTQATFEMDTMLHEIIRSYELNDDDFSHFVLLQALRQLNGIEPDDFVVRVSREDSAETRDNFKCMNDDFDYIEQYLNDAGMADYAERVYNDGENNIAVFSRKAFEEYLCDAIANVFPMVLPAGQYRSRHSIEDLIASNLVSAVPPLKMKHTDTLKKRLKDIVPSLEFLPNDSFNIREIAANGFYAKWMSKCLMYHVQHIPFDGNAMSAGDTNNLIKSLSSYTRTKPDERLVQKLYKKWLSASEFDLVSKCVMFTGKAPDLNTMSDLFVTWFLGGEFEKLERGKNLSRLEPKYHRIFKSIAEDIKKTYIEWFSGARFSDIATGTGLSGIAPDYFAASADIQKIYSGWVSEGDFKNIKIGEKISGIEPDYSLFDMQGSYLKWFVDEKFDRIKDGESLSSIKPDYQKMSDKILETYGTWFQCRWHKSIKKGEEISGIKFDTSRLAGKIHDTYTTQLESGFFDDIIKGENFSGVKADYSLMGDKVQASYRKWLEYCWLDNIERGETLSKIAPDYSKMNNEAQEAYKNSFEYGRFDKAENVKQLTGIKPTKETMIPIYEKWIKGRRFDRVKRGIDISGIAPDYAAMASEIMDAYITCMKGGDFATIEEGIRITGISPPMRSMYFYKAGDAIMKAVGLR